MKLEIFDTAEEVFHALSGRLISAMKLNRSQPFHLALSGGETGQQLFRFWADKYADKVNWDLLRFYWVDERCVEPDDDKNNYKHAEELLFRPLNIPSSHIHRIFGEQDPEIEAERYSELVKWELPGYASTPCFDCVILGIGDGGHTASIFSKTKDLYTDPRCYAVSQHPVTGQKRITMTGTIILKADMLLVPVVGLSKTDVLRSVINETSETESPASYILSRASNATVFTNCRVEQV